MTLTYPDVSRYTPGVDLTPYPAVCARSGMSDGTHMDAPLDMHDPSFGIYRLRAVAQGKLFSGYHWINHGNAKACAAHCFSITGAGVPMMIDAEDVSGNSGYNGALTVQDLLDFADEYRALGGTCWGAYLPHWYWQGRMASPDLTPLADAGLALVSSNYTAYSDTGPGWDSYGGVTPAVWQFTSSPYDKNAFQGTAADLAKLWQLPTLVSAPLPPPQPAQRGDFLVTNWTTVSRARTTDHATRVVQGLLIAWGFGVGSHDGRPDGDWGPTTDASVEAFQRAHGLAPDRVVGPHTIGVLVLARDVA